MLIGLLLVCGSALGHAGLVRCQLQTADEIAKLRQLTQLDIWSEHLRV
jgi:hypothetical protein